MISFKFSARGEVLGETIVAVMILATGITFAGTLLAGSLKNMGSSKDRVIAVNIAREGLEAVRNIRDTNWLRFSGRRRECWNHLPQTLPDSCDGSVPIPSGDFAVYKDENQRWRLRPHETDGDFDNGWLYFMDIDPLLDTNGDGDLKNDQDFYNPRITSDNSPLGQGDDPLGALYSRLSPFQRLIHIDYLDDEGNVAAAPDSGHNRMAVTSLVKWDTSGKESSVMLTTHLTDYLGRESFAN